MARRRSWVKRTGTTPTLGTERAAHAKAPTRKALLAAIEELRERTWQDRSIKTFSPEWDARVQQLGAMRKALLRSRR